MPSIAILLLLVLLSAVAGAAAVWGWARHRCQSQLMAAADRDPVTGLVARRALLESLARYRALAERMQHPLTVLFIEVDERDLLLARLPLKAQQDLEQALATRMLDRVRAYDQLGRWDCFQYLLVMPQADVASALVLVDDLRQVVASAALQPAGWSQPLTVSVGLHGLHPGRHPEVQADAGLLVAAARRALEATAADGPNRIEVEP